MAFDKVFFIYLGLIIGVPTLVTGFVTQSVWWTISVFAATNVLTRPLHFIFHYMLHALGDKSEAAKYNSAVRFILTDKYHVSSIHRIFPHDDPNLIVKKGNEIVRELFMLGSQVDEKSITESEARGFIKNQFPFLDKGNSDWLNIRGRIFLRYKAKTLTFSEGPLPLVLNSRT
jgi:hypothetical protein